MELRLVGKPAAAGTGRRMVMRAMDARGLSAEAMDVIELLTGELLANAIVHGPDEGDIGIRTWRTGHLVSVAVSDESSERPTVEPPSLTATSGRGMMLVDTLASAWGVDDVVGGGKSVWFNLDVGAA